MRHQRSGRKLNRTPAHRRALLRNLSRALIMNERIETTITKAKTLRPFVEHLITLAKKGGLANERLAQRDISSRVLLDKLFNDIGKRVSDRPGGYTRILRLHNRPGDNAPMALIELVDRKIEEKKEEKKDTTAKTDKGAKVEKTEKSAKVEKVEKVDTKRKPAAKAEAASKKKPRTKAASKDDDDADDKPKTRRSTPAKKTSGSSKK
jgi:large subunit ribosomal protein L17